MVGFDEWITRPENLAMLLNFVLPPVLDWLTALAEMWPPLEQFLSAGLRKQIVAWLFSMLATGFAYALVSALDPETYQFTLDAVYAIGMLVFNILINQVGFIAWKRAGLLPRRAS
jgi:hypothetical protein